MKTKITAHDISQLNNKIDLLTLKVDSIGQHDDENIRSIIGRIDRIEDEMKGTSNVMSSKEAADYLGISVTKLYQLTVSYRSSSLTGKCSSRGTNLTNGLRIT